MYKHDLNFLGFQCKIYATKARSSEITTQAGKKLKVVGKATLQCIYAGAQAFRFFNELGVPSGDKTSNPFQIPSFVVNGDEDVKREFMAALMGSEGFVSTPMKKSPQSFYSIRVSFNKIEDLKENAFNYATQIKTVFEKLGVNISQIKQRKANIRKDGKLTDRYDITLSNSIENMRTFFGKIGFRYATIKELKSRNIAVYLEAKCLEAEKLKEVAHKARELYKNKVSLHQISRLTCINRTTIRRWVKYDKTKIRAYNFPSYAEWLEITGSEKNLQNCGSPPRMP